MNVICVKWGDKYSAEYVNKLYSMVSRHSPEPFDFYCYTDDASELNNKINIIPIRSELTHWWLKLDLLDIFNTGDNIVLDLDIVILRNLDILSTVKTRTLSVLYSQWKESYPVLQSDKNITLYNSSVMKWSGDQGKSVYDFFQKHKDYILFKYRGIDGFLYNEPDVQVDMLPTSIAYSYWKGVRFGKDVKPEILRSDYEICIVNHSPKPHEIDSWIQNYWR